MTDGYNSIHVNFDVESDTDTAAYLPTIFRVLNSNGVLADFPTEFTTVSSAELGTNDINTEATLSGTFEFVYNDVITDVIHDDLTASTPFLIPAEFCTASSAKYIFDAKTEFTTTDNLVHFKDEIETTLYVGTSRSFSDTTINTFYIYMGVIDNKYDIPVDLYLCNEKYYNYKTSIFSTVVDLVGISLDVDLEKGRTGNYPMDLFSAKLTTISGNRLDVFSTVSGVKGYGLDVATESGTLAYIPTDCHSTAVTVSGGVECDVRTWSLEFGNFFIEDGVFTAASSTAWIDIVDNFCPVDISNSYFVVGSGQVSTYFEPINNGYRMLYDPIDNYEHLGEFELIAHAQNIYGDVLENNYKFLYGGNIEYNDVVDFGPGNQVMIWSKAHNTEVCRQFSTSAYYFETAEFSSRNLEVSINPVGYVDLSASMYPQNTYFFYGRTYTVTISGVKDYSGNVLPEYTYSFTIENPL